MEKYGSEECFKQRDQIIRKSEKLVRNPSIKAKSDKRNRLFI